MAAGAVLALLGGWVAVSLYLTAGDRKDVVVVSSDVARYGEITRDDLTTARVAAGADVETVSGSDLDDVVGRVAAVELLEGSLLSADQLYPEDELLWGQNEAVVPIEQDANMVGDGVLEQGVDVRVVIESSGSGGSDRTPVPGWILRIGSESDGQGRTRVVYVVVPHREAPEVAASAGQVRLVLDGES